APTAWRPAGYPPGPAACCRGWPARIACRSTWFALSPGIWRLVETFRTGPPLQVRPTVEFTAPRLAPGIASAAGPDGFAVETEHRQKIGAFAGRPDAGVEVVENQRLPRR